MTPEEVDQLAGICSDAAQTEKGFRLYCAIVTDAVFNRVVGDHPDPAGLAEELGTAKIAAIANREIDELSDDEKERLANFAADHMRKLVVAVGKAGFTAMKNGIISSDDLTPDFLITAAACACVVDASS